MDQFDRVRRAAFDLEDGRRGFDEHEGLCHPVVLQRAAGKPGQAVRSTLLAIADVAGFGALSCHDGPDLSTERDREILRQMIAELQAGVDSLRMALQMNDSEKEKQ